MRRSPDVTKWEALQRANFYRREIKTWTRRTVGTSITMIVALGVFWTIPNNTTLLVWSMLVGLSLYTTYRLVSLTRLFNYYFDQYEKKTHTYR